MGHATWVVSALTGAMMLAAASAGAQDAQGKSAEGSWFDPVKRDGAAARKTARGRSGSPKNSAGHARAKSGAAKQAKTETKSAKPASAKTAPAKPESRAKMVRTAHRQGPPCLKPAVEFERGFGATPEPIVLTRCDGRRAPKAIEQLSILARPMNVPRPQLPTTPVLYSGKSRGEWAYGVKLLDEGLVARLQRIVDHFHAKKLVVVSGYRPTSVGSFHQSAKALDFRIEGTSNEALVAYCRKVGDTGCGYYPNSSFVHMDVRPSGTGHVFWIDSSGPGEPAHYVSSWPPPKDELGREIQMTKRIPSVPLDDTTHPDLFPPLPASATDANVDARTDPRPPASPEDPFRP
jgi:hypothetical protein